MTCATQLDGDLLAVGVAGKLAGALLHILGRARGLKEGPAGWRGLFDLAAGQPRQQPDLVTLLTSGKVTLPHLLLLSLPLPGRLNFVAGVYRLKFVFNFLLFFKLLNYMFY